jgi:formiminotetrahydrofolate cyclodeaminase
MSSGSSEVSGAVGDLDGGGVEEDAVGRYLADLASAAPAPGGGSAAALAAALGAALVAMTCRVTAKHAGAAPEGRPLGELAEQADSLRRRLTALANDDARVYSDVIAARRLPVPERERRCSARSSARPRCRSAWPPRAATCSPCASESRHARAPALSATWAWRPILAHGALRAGALTARTNLAGIADGDFTGETARRVDALVAEGMLLAERIETALAARGARAS